MGGELLHCVCLAGAACRSIMLQRRETGRRAQRRMAREAAAATAATTSAASIDDSSPSSTCNDNDQQQRDQRQQCSNSTAEVTTVTAESFTASIQISTGESTRMKRGPAEDIQKKIDAAIALRSGQGVGKGNVKERKEAHLIPDGMSNMPKQQRASTSTEPDIPDAQYEYLDHTADIQIHSWGTNLASALEQLAIGMFGYMTSISTVEVDSDKSAEIASNVIAKGHDLHSLVFSFLDEWLFLFHDTGFVARQVNVVEYDRATYTILSQGKGEVLDLEKHPQGTEVKAITYSNMQIHEANDKCEIWVIVDI